ncbi:hypothetical protein BDZ45DRAFT_682538 [Acephala macrosclerotiorum]|nr:hypothetical protein BDZ45DRAFT_682538 [Acephala macrosclerotiorum]
MPKNSKNSVNSRKGNSFELLDESDGNDSITVQTTSARGRPLKRTQPFEPNSPPHAKRANSTRATTSQAIPAPVDTDQWAQVKALLTRVESALLSAERRAERAEQRIETLEEFIRNELFPRVNTPPRTGPPPPPSPPSSPPPSVAPAQIPGVGLDLSRVAIPEIKEGNAGAVRRRVNEALKGRNITCLGVNAKGNGRYRLLFQGKDIDNVRKDDTWVRTHFDRGTLYGEQWYPVRVDRAYHGAAVDEMGCLIFGQLNGVKVHKMRWLGNVSVDKEYRSMVVYLDTKGEVDELLAKMTVTMANGECAYTRPFVIGRQPARCYRCHLYGHLHYRCRAPAPICGQCALPGHSASTCTSTTFKCAPCGGKGAHKATDPGCPVYRRELAKLRPSPLHSYE